MARPRKFVSDAERQAAYRARRAAAGAVPPELLAALPQLVTEFENLLSQSLFPTLEQRQLLDLLRRSLPDA